MPKKRDDAGKPLASRAVQRRAYLHQRSHVSSMKQFEHQPLGPPNQQIRLLNFLEETQIGLVFELEVCSILEVPPPYAAISYAWGQAGRTQNIVINGHRLEVGQNAHYALWQATVAARDRGLKHFWIDSVCIDQVNLREKSHQVGMMGKIYSMATIVYACVGQHSGSSRLLAQHMAADDIREDVKKAFIDLGHRPYWSRLWIIQELVLAYHFRVLCGDIVVSLGTLCAALDSDPLASPHPFHELKTTPMFAVIESIWSKEDGITGQLNRNLVRFEDCVIKYRDWGCADPRDRIYAFVSFDHGVPMVPNYNTSSAKLAIDFLNHREQQRLDKQCTSMSYEEISTSLVVALQLETDACQAIRSRLLRKKSILLPSMSRHQSLTFQGFEAASKARESYWRNAPYAFLEPNADDDSALNVTSSRLLGTASGDGEWFQRVNTPFARQCVQDRRLKKITAGRKGLGFVSSLAAPGDLLVDIHSSKCGWPWLVIRQDGEDGTLTPICCAWLTECAIDHHNTSSFLAHSSRPASMGEVDTGNQELPLHDQCGVSISPEDMLTMAAIVLENDTIKAPDRLADLATDDDCRYVSVCARWDTA